MLEISWLTNDKPVQFRTSDSSSSVIQGRISVTYASSHFYSGLLISIIIVNNSSCPQNQVAEHDQRIHIISPDPVFSPLELDRDIVLLESKNQGAGWSCQIIYFNNLAPPALIFPGGGGQRVENDDDDDDDEVFATELPDMNRTCRDAVTMNRYYHEPSDFKAVLRSRNYLFSAPPQSVISAPAPVTALYIAT